MQKSSRPLWICIAFVFFGAALLAPPLYWLSHGWIAQPFHRYVDRALMLSALAGLFLFRKGLGLDSARALGLAFSPRRGRDLLGGGALGLASAALFTECAVLTGGRAWIWHGWLSMPFFIGVLAGAAILAFLEEILFRGVVQTLLIRAWGKVWGLGGAVLLFALFHFIKVPPSFAPQPVTWASGFEAVARAFAPLGALASGPMAFRFATLAVVGLCLGTAFLRTRRLWLPIGLHAGWIIGAKASQALTLRLTDEWAAGSFLENRLSLFILFLLLPLLWRWPRAD